MKRFLIPLIFLFTINLSYAQGLSFFARGQYSIGFESQVLDHANRTIGYSPGSGLGAELGVFVDIAKDWSLACSVGDQFAVMYMYENYNGNSNETSLIFNRAYISLAGFRSIQLTEKLFNGLIFGAGAQYVLPGDLIRVENNNSLGRVSYHSSIAPFLEGGVKLKFSETFFFIPTLRYRYSSFKASAYRNGSPEMLAPELKNLNASGMDFSILFVKRLSR